MDVARILNAWIHRSRQWSLVTTETIARKADEDFINEAPGRWHLHFLPLTSSSKVVLPDRSCLLMRAGITTCDLVFWKKTKKQKTEPKSNQNSLEKEKGKKKIPESYQAPTIGITWGLVRNASSLAPLQTYWVRIRVTSSPGDLRSHHSLRSTVWP